MSPLDLFILKANLILFLTVSKEQRKDYDTEISFIICVSWSAEQSWCIAISSNFCQLSVGFVVLEGLILIFQLSPDFSPAPNNNIKCPNNPYYDFKQPYPQETTTNQQTVWSSTW